MFGGYIAALADSLLGLVIMTVLEDSEAFTTSDLRISFFRPAVSGTLTIEGPATVIVVAFDKVVGP